MLSGANIRKEQKVTELNLEILTNHGPSSHLKNGNVPGGSAMHTSSSSLEIK